MLETPVGLRGEHSATMARLQANLGGASMAKAESSIHTRAPSGRLAPSERPLIAGLTSDHFLSQALAAQMAGKLTAAEVSECEACVNSGRHPRPQLVSKVLEAAA